MPVKDAQDRVALGDCGDDDPRPQPVHDPLDREVALAHLAADTPQALGPRLDLRIDPIAFEETGDLRGHQVETDVICLADWRGGLLDRIVDIGLQDSEAGIFESAAHGAQTDSIREGYEELSPFPGEQPQISLVRGAWALQSDDANSDARCQQAQIRGGGPQQLGAVVVLMGRGVRPQGRDAARLLDERRDIGAVVPLDIGAAQELPDPERSEQDRRGHARVRVLLDEQAGHADRDVAVPVDQPRRGVERPAHHLRAGRIEGSFHRLAERDRFPKGIGDIGV